MKWLGVILVLFAFGKLASGNRYNNKTGSVYLFHPECRTYAEARQVCKSRGGDLVVIADDDEAQLLNDLFRENPDHLMEGCDEYSGEIYIGVHFNELIGKFNDIKGETLSYTEWDVGQPSNVTEGTVGEQCVSMRRNKKLNDLHCGKSRPFVCEISAGYQTTYMNKFGENYGTEWTLLPVGNGSLLFVDMTEESLSEITPRGLLGDIIFRLYTRKNSNEYEDVSEFAEKAINSVIDAKAKSKHFNSSAPIKVITHGWMSTADSAAVMTIKDAFLKQHDVNVITVDWADIGTNIFYPTAAVNTRFVGERVAHFLDGLAAVYNVDGSQIQLIGHSLGAHVMGVASARSKLTISRVTGLDPARPLFEVPMAEEAMRLDPSDATLVDVIHTCAGVLGFSSPLGHVDFYPNGGLPGQPGCEGFQVLIETCSHSRSYEYFAASIESPRGYKAHRCDSWDSFTKGLCRSEEAVFMGHALQPNTTGTYYMHTDSPTVI